MNKFIPILLVGFFGVSLVGCVPAVLVVGAAGAATVGGAIIYDKRTYRTMTQDHNARAIAQRHLDDSEMLKGHSHISISVFNNLGLLVGQAQTEEIRQEAYRLTVNVPNIAHIYNEVIVGPATSTGQRTKDAWITTKVRTAMLKESGLQSTNLKVITENSMVYLMGIVTRQQSELAASVARQVSGVKKVITVFKYE